MVNVARVIAPRISLFHCRVESKRRRIPHHETKYPLLDAFCLAHADSESECAARRNESVLGGLALSKFAIRTNPPWWTCTANGPERSVRRLGRRIKKSPIPETWFCLFRSRIMRRKFTVLLGLRDRPQLHAPDSDPFRALAVWAKSKPSIALCARAPAIREEWRGRCGGSLKIASIISAHKATPPRQFFMTSAIGAGATACYSE